jgi:hypothetical protein
MPRTLVPTDQNIIDEYFRLNFIPGCHSISGVFALVAVYGKHPKELNHFQWGPRDSILLPGRKRPIYPLHPQWVALFNLKKKIRDTDKIGTFGLRLEQAIQKGQVQIDIPSLLLSYKMRKVFYQPIKRKQLVPAAPEGACSLS